MKRRGLFGLLFGSMALAQPPRSSEELTFEGGIVTGETKGFKAWWNRKPENGECPVCGTMAQPMKKAHVVRKGVCVNDKYKEVDCMEAWIDSRMWRCKRCNCMFGQDAE